jgi:valyl-tRNA synthetase
MAYLTPETQDVRMPVQFECPHCEALMEQTKKNRELPRVQCKKCGEEFSTQWARSEADLALPRGAVVSERFEVARNFCNKLWNASRFAMLNLNGYKPAPVSAEELTIEDRWILSRLATVAAQVTEALDAYHYADAARTLYDFAWDDFCSFYVEMLKNRLQDDTQRPVAQRVLAHTLDTLLRLLHPMLSFITEGIWQLLGKVAPERGLSDPQAAAASIMTAPWPVSDPAHRDEQIEQQFAEFQAVLGALNKIRSGQNIPPKSQVEFLVRAGQATTDLLRPMEPYFNSMANAVSVAWGEEVPTPATQATINLPFADVIVDLKDFIDVDAEIERLERRKQKLDGQIQGKEKKLSNASFVERAPEQVVQRERDGLDQLREEAEAIQKALDDLRKQQDS